MTQRLAQIIAETKAERAWAWLVFVCGCGLAYLAIIERVIYIFFQVIGIPFDMPESSGRMDAIVKVIGLAAALYGGSKFIGYQRDKNCSPVDCAALRKQAEKKDDTEKAG